ncbi:MAG: Holliday junction branch migration protein RuvA [Actinobacteria bacterium]|nr:Holliday junction branch migration protein RuvA [Actinomycetota bacterium]
MIGLLRGALLECGLDGEILIEVAGVGYRVTVPTSTLGLLGDVGADVTLYVHTHVREDAIVLFGFVDRAQRSCFEALIGAHGVGPSLALSVLNVHSPSELQRAVSEDDLDALTLVPGVGKKTAAKLLIDLKSRLGLDGIGTSPGFPASRGGPLERTSRGEVRAALVELGYGSEEIRTALQALPSTGAVEDLLRIALKELAGAR